MSISSLYKKSLFYARVAPHPPPPNGEGAIGSGQKLPPTGAPELTRGRCHEVTEGLTDRPKPPPAPPIP